MALKIIAGRKHGRSLKGEMEIDMELDEKFKMICEKKIPQIISQIKGRKLYIWGAGKGGKIVEAIMKEQGILLTGFIDQKAERKH